MTLRQHAETIWRVGVAAVDSSKLVRQAVQHDGTRLQICGDRFSLDRLRRIVVVGAGKAGAGMATGLEAALGPELVRSKTLGWINVPSDCIRQLDQIHLHSARPAGVNEPTLDGVFGSDRILELVASLTDDDVCLVLISGGGSALLPAPAIGITLEDKLAVTRFLMHSGATIHELNTVRKRLSRIKGGGLVRSARAGRMIALIISDVPGDPLDIIASGPTVCDTGTVHDALTILERFSGQNELNGAVPDSVWRLLRKEAEDKDVHLDPVIPCANHIIGNNQTALAAAVEQAMRMGYEVRNLGTNRQGVARDVGFELAELCLQARGENRRSGICFIAGGEPVVKLAVTDQPRKGGRNQEVALAAGCRWKDANIDRMIVLSGGTDGEDGPTDAAGAYFDAITQRIVHEKGLTAEEFLAINDSYSFFERAGGLLKTGPTHTNVMDLQIALVGGHEK